MPEAPQIKGRLAQVDSRHRITVSEADANAVYGVEERDGSVVLVPTKYRTSGRRVRVDARRRLQLQEVFGWNLYFVDKDPRGVIFMEPAVALPARTLSAFKKSLQTA